MSVFIFLILVCVGLFFTIKKNKINWQGVIWGVVLMAALMPTPVGPAVQGLLDAMMQTASTAVSNIASGA